MARTRWPSDLGTPASCTGQADQTGSAGGCQELGPGRQIDLRTARAASADSEVRPGPRPQTLRPYQAKTSEAGPEAQSTSSLPITGSFAIGWPLESCRPDPPDLYGARASPQGLGMTRSSFLAMILVD